MERIKMIVGAGVIAGLLACAGIAAMAYQAVATGSQASLVSQSQQAKLDALVERM